MSTLRSARWSKRQRLAVVDMAAQNGLGLDPNQIWAFRRAELVAHWESPFRCLNGSRATMGHMRTLPAKSYGAERLCRVTSALVAQLQESLARLGSESRLVAILGLPTRMGEGAEKHDQRERQRIEANTRTEFAKHCGEARVRVRCTGHASLGPALLDAAAVLDSGVADVVAVGGLDTAYDPVVIERLLERGSLFDGENLDSMIPGEGGALLLVMTPVLARAAGLDPLAFIEAVGCDEEVARPDNDVANLALALTRAARAATEPLRERNETLPVWYADTSNEAFRIQELQSAYPRVSQGIMDASSSLDLLPQYLGDLGAATMATGVVIAIEALLRGERSGARSALITGASDEGERSATLLASEGDLPRHGA